MITLQSNLRQCPSQRVTLGHAHLLGGITRSRGWRPAFLVVSTRRPCYRAHESSQIHFSSLGCTHDSMLADDLRSSCSWLLKGASAPRCMQSAMYNCVMHLVARAEALSSSRLVGLNKTIVCTDCANTYIGTMIYIPSTASAR